MRFRQELLLTLEGPPRGAFTLEFSARSLTGAGEIVAPAVVGEHLSRVWNIIHAQRLPWAVALAQLWPVVQRACDEMENDVRCVRLSCESQQAALDVFPDEDDFARL